MKSNLVLIGMPTAGKSTVGVIAAKVLGKMFVDTDLVLQQREGDILAGIIASRGIDGFLEREEAAVLGLEARNSVIATGGSVVYSEAAMKHLAHDGTILYLKVSEEELKRRLHHARERGVVLREGQSLEALFKEREALYRKYAEYVIDDSSFTIEDTVQAVCRIFQS